MFLFSIMKILIHVVTSFLKVLLAGAANSSVSFTLAQVLPNS